MEISTSKKKSFCFTKALHIKVYGRLLNIKQFAIPQLIPAVSTNGFGGKLFFSALLFSFNYSSTLARSYSEVKKEMLVELVGICTLCIRMHLHKLTSPFGAIRKSEGILTMEIFSFCFASLVQSLECHESFSSH